MPHPPDIAELIRREAVAAGFDACRFVDVTGDWLAGLRLQAFLDAGRHGTMSWMEDTRARRSHPRAMWPDARSAIVLGVNYGPAGDPRLAQADPARAAISVYAQGDDYHELIKKRLKALARTLVAATGCELKVFVDTAPLMEKPLAEASGMGFQGKHTNLVSREFGSWLFLGVILTTLDLPAEAAPAGGCGACQACLAACPTDAFPAPYQLDARRCISYLTIEHAGPIPAEFRPALGNRIYGCDDCLAACPWNKFASLAREQRLHAREALRSPRLVDLSRLDDAAFRLLFSKSPVKRIGRDRFVRNVVYALGSAPADAETVAAVAERVTDEAPLVRGAAVWSLSRLSPLRVTEFVALQSSESHPDVQAEWAALRPPG